MSKVFSTITEIAKFFKESVSFDFDRETIFSYQQIECNYENFYTLLDREAFFSLLNDCLGCDNQLANIFKDIYDAHLGIQKFADVQERRKAKGIINYFLLQPKYQYYQSSISKVYLAFNVWLEFFNEQHIEPGWSSCPFCGSDVKNGQCISCGKTTNDCLAAADELTILLKAEQEGKTTVNPRYWDAIHDNSEFYFVYKNEIELLRMRRFEEGELKYFNNSVNVANEVNPIKQQLMYYGRRLLNFSRNNQLVHFRQIKSYTIELITRDNNTTLRNIILGRGKIYIKGWRNFHPKMLYRCKICGRIENYSYDFSAKRIQPARTCRVCDAKNAHNRKSLSPLKEKLTILPDDKYTCSCGVITPVIDLENTEYRCPICGKLATVESAPLISSDILKNCSKNEMISSIGDFSTRETLRRLMNRSNNLERNFGLHVLYLAYGFLRWKSASGTEYNSPILLCPINLATDTSKDKYYFDVAQSASNCIFELNETLVQMLGSYSRTCSIALPKFDNSNISSYFSLISNNFLNADSNIKDIVGDWVIEKRFVIGLFHYQKLQLHYDMENNIDKYLDNPVIRRLCGDSLATITQSSKIERPSIGYMLLDADSSQEEVIKRAQEGQSFILQGPPGSGKSQTITNIIGNALGFGKTVLFVTEKAAARSIIMDNLQRCYVSGDRKLTEFVLDFDFFKKRGGAIGREPFINELNRYLIPYSPSGGYDDHLLIEEEMLYNKIQQFMHEAHGEYGGKNYLRLLNDMAPFAGCKELHASSDLIPKDMGEFAKLCNTLEKYYEVASVCPSGIAYKQGVLHGCKGDNSNKLYRTSVAYYNSCEQIGHGLEVLRSFGWQIKPQKNLLKECVNMLKRWAMMPAFTSQILENFDLEKLNSLIVRATNRLNHVIILSQHPGLKYLGDVVHDKTMKFNVESAVIQGGKYKSIFSRLGKKYRIWRKNIFSCFKSVPTSMKYVNTLTALNIIAQYKDYYKQHEINRIQSNEDKKLFGYEPINVEEWKRIIEDLEVAKAILIDNNKAILNLVNNSSWVLRFEHSVHMTTLTDILSLADSLHVAINNEEAEGNIISSYFENDINTHYYPPYMIMAKEVVENSQYLSSIYKRNLSLCDLRSNGWVSILDELIDENEVDFEHAKGRLFKTYYVNGIEAFINDNQLNALRDFMRIDHEKLLIRYGNLEKHILYLGAKRIYDTLKSYLKYAASCKSGGEFSTYPKLRSKTHYSIKSTIFENWDYISHIKPCFMMSPLNVSQYIDIGVTFDVVIFDEASQIFTEDALASIVRGKQVIIAGDSKQLPPCDFFRAGDSFQDDDIYYDEDNDNEHSLLNTADSVLPDASVSLTWHYRSSDESLINFANQAMDYKLITFPSAKRNPDDGVEFIAVPYSPNRCYVAGKGGSHINPEEVDKIINLIYREMIDPNRNAFSIGIVAFSNAQAFEIESKWEEFKQEPSRKENIEKWENSHKEEPLIFCNLDTVQGDERDTIIISICYSCDANGKFILPYLGRIRLESGKKRINVAITRARHRMIVVSMLDEFTLRSAINASSAPENNKTGANMLLEFLRYARNSSSGRDIECSQSENDIAKSVCKVLDENHIIYDCEVGMSECKINIAIRNTENTRDYCFGIIIDDPGRIDFDSVREYSRLTEQVLATKYGWKLYRIYPASWVNDYEREKSLLLENIRRAMELN